METIVLDLWQEIKAALSFAVILTVIGSGYVVRLLNLFDSVRLTIRVAFLGGGASFAVFFFTPEITFSHWIVSFFFSFGLHTVIMKYIDRKIKVLK